MIISGDEDIAVRMSYEAWDEVLCALDSKRRAIENGDYGVGETSQDNESWTHDLSLIQAHIEETMEGL